MKRELLIGVFANEHDLLNATRTARQQGFSIADAFTPFPVHGMDEAMGLKPSRLGIFCFLCGLFGVLAAMTLQHWTMAIDWPINVGGRPFNSWPAFVPVAFEVLVLFAGFGVVFAFLAVSRLFPGKSANIVNAKVSDDQFVLVLNARSDAEVVSALLRAHGAASVELREESDTTSGIWPCSLGTINSALAALFSVGILMNWILSSDHAKPNMEFLPEMVRSVPFESYAAHEKMSGGMVLQAPPEGSIARGQLPLHFQATPKDAERASEVLQNPFQRGDKRWQPRGAQVYANYCAVCHGADGTGAGPVSQRGMPPPPSLLLKKNIKTADGKEVEVEKFQDGQLFHIITFGQGTMASYAAQIEREDRWAVILHVRQLQNRKGGGQ